MAPLRSLLAALSLCAATSAFAPASPAFGVRTAPSTSLFAGQEDKDGGGSALKEATKVGQKTLTKEKVKEKTQQKRKSKKAEPIQRRKEKFEDAPLYKVMLIGDDEYDQAHVIERMCDIIEGMDEDAAATCFKTAQQSGKALAGKYPFEHAELYKEQLARSDPMIFSDISEEDT